MRESDAMEDGRMREVERASARTKLWPDNGFERIEDVEFVGDGRSKSAGREGGEVGGERARESKGEGERREGRVSARSSDLG